MATKILQCFSIFFLFVSLIPIAFSDHTPKTFIVHVARSEKPTVFNSHLHWYASILNSLDHPSPKLLYNYEKTIHGFSATLTPSQAKTLESVPGILLVVPSETRQLATTHTYKFLGLSKNSGVWPSSNYGENVIIGVLDTGVWPDRRSFYDAGMSPVPSYWKGKCESSVDFLASSCNRKIIGARSFDAGQPFRSSPRDENGHGTHVASTAAGSAVSNASFYGFGGGEARGMATKARIAIYRVCHYDGCGEADILAGIEQAISDGVHIISLSISGGTEPYYRSIISIGAFGAMQNGILFSAAAGNAGPQASTSNHLYPWALTVGASSIDREFRSDVFLGDGRIFIGSSLYYERPLPKTFSRVVDAADFGNRYCSKNRFSRESELVGKIIVCVGSGNPMAQGDAVSSVNAVGMILTNTANYGEELRAEPHYIIPATRVSFASGEEIRKYIKTTRDATANILSRGTIFDSWPPAPKVAAFSSRGPNPLIPQILKPDLIAPGLNILAAWTGVNSPSSWPYDTRRVEFNVISGTSMACPHVSGLAALVKSVHPNWSPSAIKSALMTTSYVLDNSGSPIKDLSTGMESTPFIHGAGHVDPNRAAHPGLVYDMGVNDYVAFLCSIGYDSNKIKIILKKDVNCDQIFAAIGARVTPGDLNLPSFAVFFKDEKSSVTYRRRVTNVGNNSNAVYTANVSSPPGIQISVKPNKLSFGPSNPTQAFTVKFTSSGGFGMSARFGSIEWTDGTHRVRSPVAISYGTSITSDYDEPLASM